MKMKFTVFCNYPPLFFRPFMELTIGTVDCIQCPNSEQTLSMQVTEGSEEHMLIAQE